MSRQIRRYDPADRDAVVDICIRTAFDGEDARGRVAAPEIYAEIWCEPYLSLAPDLAWVLVDDDAVLGYVLGAADSAVFSATAEREWFPGARERHPRGSIAPDAPGAWLLDVLHTPAEPLADFLAPYPAHLHVDLLPAAQGGGWGRQLLATLFAELRGRGVPGVHLGASVRNTRAIGFYRHLGMAEVGHGEGVVYLALAL